MCQTITTSVLEAHAQCQYKGYLRYLGEQGIATDYEELLDRRKAQVRRTVLADLARGDCQPATIPGPCALLDDRLINCGAPYLFDVMARSDSLAFVFDGLKRESRSDPHHYIPVLFHPGSKVRREQKTTLELACLVLGRCQGRTPTTGVVYYGRNCRCTRVRLDQALATGRQILAEVDSMAHSPSPPRLMLNKHCSVCEFRERCRRQAVEEDSLSLIGRISEKELKRYERKGLLTLEQLARTFRPRRNPKKGHRCNTRQHALHAKAIRDNTVYILDTPDLPESSVSMFVDCEGNPDEGYVYLIGLLVVTGETEQRFSFWADDPSEEADIFEHFVSTTRKYKHASLFCYGSYEKTFLTRMRKKAKCKQSVDNILAKLVNVLSLVYTHLYFPCYSNGLKDIARVLGCSWSDPEASGIQSIVWRHAWEESHDADWKHRLAHMSHRMIGLAGFGHAGGCCG